MIRGGLGRLDYGPYVYFMQLCRKYLQMIYRIMINMLDISTYVDQDEWGHGRTEGSLTIGKGFQYVKLSPNWLQGFRFAMLQWSWLFSCSQKVVRARSSSRWWTMMEMAVWHKRSLLPPWACPMCNAIWPHWMYESRNPLWCTVVFSQPEYVDIWHIPMFGDKQ